MFSARRQRILQGRPLLFIFFLLPWAAFIRFVVEDGLSDTQILRRNLQQLVVRPGTPGIAPSSSSGRHQTQSVIGAGGTGVSLLLFLQTFTVISSCLGDTPTTMPSYTFTPGPINSVPRSWALNRP